MSWIIPVIAILAVLAVLMIVSRVEGHVTRYLWEGEKGVSRKKQMYKFLAHHYEGRSQRRGRWAWRNNETYRTARAYVRVFGLWWWVPVWVSKGAFNLLVLEKTVNGD